MAYLRMCGVHFRAAAVCEQWPPEVALALKEANNNNNNNKITRMVLSTERIIEMLDKCGFGVVNSGISVIRTFYLSEPLDFWSWPKGFG